MSLILAIEPDRRQVAHLISIVRHVQGAELILADTTERALESIGNNVPDLILVPALLSPQDDAALAAALRVIATAAHVQMLTIPTFATPKPQAKRGVLSAFRRKPAAETPLDGCDPKVFAEEIASYIERANQERAAALLYEDEQGTGTFEPFQTDRVRADTVQADEPVQDDAPRYEESRGEDVQEEIHPASWAASVFADTPVAEEPEPYVQPLDEPVVEETVAAPVLEYAAAPEPEPEPEYAAVPEYVAPPLPEPEPEPEPVAMAADEPDDVVATPPAAEPPVPAMALDEFVATLESTTPVVVEEEADEVPVAAAPDPFFEVAATPEFEDFLADFERANLSVIPVIEEVRAEQWMADADELEPASDGGADPFEDEADNIDIDLSIELEAVLHSDEPAPAPAPAPAALKPFEPVLPVERVEPLPMAAWQAWPRLDWTPPAKPASADVRAGHGHGNGNGNGNGNGHNGVVPGAPAESSVAEFDQVAEFEEALEAEEASAVLEPFEPVVPVERVEPMPMTAWHAWPRLEGVTAEAYQEPIAPRKAAAKPEWVELMRSLREDIARRRAELAASGPVPPPTQKPPRPRTVEPRVQPARPAAVAAPPATVAPPQAPVSAVPADAKKPRPKRVRPIEDEWGLFDPEQCGFAALLDKLDEITVTPPSSQSRRPSR